MSSSSSFSSVRSNPSANMPYEIEEELLESEKSDFEADHEGSHVDDDSDIEAYFDEPIADEVWLAEYNRRREEGNEKMRELQLRWNGNKPVTSWCSCGNCSIELLQNARECCCCKEIKNCVQFLAEFSEKSVQTVTDKGPLECVIEHPGFQASCLNRWSLELAAGNYKTRDGHRYSQSGSKEGFLRVVAYRQFTRMVRGWLKDRRITMPSCAYNIIRTTHKPKDDTFTGFEEVETDVESQ